MAHAGIVESLVLDPGGPGRFDDVRGRVRSLVQGGDGAADVRFYGGFAFRDDHRPADVWEGFPSTLFHLPAVELTAEGDGHARLVVRAAVPRDADPAGARAAAESEARRVAALLRGGRYGRESGSAEGRGAEGGGGGTAVERATWERAVGETLDAIRDGRISKAVLARTLDVEVAEDVDPVDVALALWAQSRGAHAFLFEPEPGRSIVGAAPETVATLRADGSFQATAVAGSIRRGDTEEERTELARRLLASDKDRNEQRVVVEDMVRRLAPLVGEVEVQSEPHVLTLARIQHLETEIRATAPPGRHVLELVEALHPTPAVCGVPRDAALAFLEEEEPFDRGWYAGPVGWFDGEGTGVFVPALRTAVVQGGHWRLFAGAGIVAGSDPFSEWEETDIKFEPVLRALASAGASR